VDELRPRTLFLQRCDTFGLPARQFFQRIYANAQFDEMQHDTYYILLSFAVTLRARAA
jgi:hypothetical protein